MSTDRTTEILNYLSAISREIGAFRTETNERFLAIETEVRDIRAEMRGMRTEMSEVRTEMRTLNENFDRRFDKLGRVFLDVRARTSELEERVHALDGKHPDPDLF